MPPPQRLWFVYLLSCSDATLYCGITTDLQRRLRQHNRGRAGAKYTRARRPVTLVYAREFPDRAGAARCEYRLKQLDRAQKLELLAKARQEHGLNGAPEPSVSITDDFCSPFLG